MSVNKVVRVYLRSDDVIHSFFVPSFRLKQDAVPGREIQVWFKATKPGRYELPAPNCAVQDIPAWSDGSMSILKPITRSGNKNCGSPRNTGPQTEP